MQHVGIDFSSGVELAQHTEALGPDGGSGSARTEPPADAEAGLPSFTDTAFFLYYDEVAEKYDMRDPLVVAPDGSEVECSKPSSLDRGVRYFCVVTLKDGRYAAEVLSESGAEGKDPGGYDALWKVHLFNVPKEGEEDYGDEEPGHEDGMQYHTGAVVVGGGGGGGSVTPDDVSTEFIPEPEEGEEPTGQEGKLQIFDFDTNESDSPEGFVERLKADTETGDIKLRSGSNIMLLARRNGKMVYIPLSADGKDPEDEKPYDPENPDPCAHPGDNAPGGATSESIDGGGTGGVDGGAGGVPAGGGEPHTGDDDCNCERI